LAKNFYPFAIKAAAQPLCIELFEADALILPDISEGFIVTIT
jgi:hypothetical protein